MHYYHILLLICVVPLLCQLVESRDVCRGTWGRCQRGKGNTRGGKNKGGKARSGESIDAVDSAILDEEAVAEIKSICGQRNCKDQTPKNIAMKAALENQLSKDLAAQYNGDEEAARAAVEERFDSIQSAKQALLESQGIGEVVTAADNGVWEGDMLLNTQQANDIIRSLESEPGTPSGKRRKRSAVFFETFADYKWDLPIRYVIDDSSPPFSETEKSYIREAIKDIESKSCVRFVESSNGPHLKFIKYITLSFCGQSPVGNQGSYNTLYINPACEEVVGVVVHEILHSLGIHHHQTRVDRDDYVEIQWDNIDPQNFELFSKVDNLKYTTYGVPYDYYSVMHYTADAGAIAEGTPALKAKKQPSDHFTNVMGRRAGGMSSRDAEMLRKMYCQPGCEDQHVWCGYWQSKGYCAEEKGFFDYMVTTCPKSCEYC